MYKLICIIFYEGEHAYNQIFLNNYYIECTKIIISIIR